MLLAVSSDIFLFFCCSEYVDTAVAQDKGLWVEVRQKEMKKTVQSKEWGGRKKTPHHKQQLKMAFKVKKNT